MSAWEEFPSGAQVRMKATFDDSNDNLVDPTTVTFTLTLPDGTNVNPTAVKEETGVYHADYTVSDRGWYLWRAVGSGSNAGATPPRQFSVI